MKKILLIVCMCLITSIAYADVTITITLTGDVTGSDSITLNPTVRNRVNDWWNSQKNEGEARADFLVRMLKEQFRAWQRSDYKTTQFVSNESTIDSGITEP